MANRSSNSALTLVPLVFLGIGAVVAPSACVYPEYTFNEPEPTGEGGSNAASTGANMSSVSASSSGPGSGGSAGTSASSSSGSTGGSGGGENCWNGSDDDADGATDCADSDCTPISTCVSNVPFGWSGYAVVFEGLPNQEPACPAGFPSTAPYKGNTTLIAPPATCSTCTCATPTGGTCDYPNSITITNATCNNTPTGMASLSLPTTWNGSCFQPDYFPSQTGCGGPCAVSVSAAPATVVGGTCATSGGVPTLPPTSWAILGKACGDSTIGGGCGNGMVCQPKPMLPYLPGLCISKPGDQSCPMGDFSQKHVFYGAVDDSRDCTDCACGAAAGSTCTATLEVYGDSGGGVCTSLVTSFAAGTCMDLTGNPQLAGRKGSITQPPNGGMCPPSGGAPTGTAVPTDPTTFCCIP